jgi:hypothetical protein
MGGFDQPSLALPLPNGDILLNEHYNHRVCVVDPATTRAAVPLSRRCVRVRAGASLVKMVSRTMQGRRHPRWASNPKAGERDDYRVG